MLVSELVAAGEMGTLSHTRLGFLDRRNFSKFPAKPGRNPKAVSPVLSSQEITKHSEALLELRAAPQTSFARDFPELTFVPGANPDIISALQERACLGEFAIPGIEVAAPKAGKDLQSQAFQATMAALGGMLVCAAFRFEWVSGVVALVAVIHDVLVTAAFIPLVNREIELTVIAALLTLVAYSMNDTNVILGRVRAHLTLLGRLVKQSANQAPSERALTSGLMLIAISCPLLFMLLGGQGPQSFSLALLVGVLAGCCSSIFAANQPLSLWDNLAECPGSYTSGTRARLG